mgnify:CR=1 FL=1
MTIYLEDMGKVTFPFEPEEQIKKLAAFVTDFVKCPYEPEISVTLVTKEEIHELNRTHRNVDRPTDVLSFPMTDYPVPGQFEFLEDCDDCFHPESGELMLGDIVISKEKVLSQAEEFGHSALREYAFLIVHSVLHLIGYDHMQDEERQIMERKQKEIMERLNILR